ncbi:MAG: Gfo/Idh/MocA family oxidoreductase [Candidatus Dormiibacterota bacterium]
MTDPPLRWGILGAADIAEKAVMPAIQGAGGELTALATRSPERGRALAARFRIPHVYSSYRELVEADLDAVYIPLPNSLHLPWTLQAAAAGKHVLCEKPLALTAAEARQMQDAAQLHGVVLAEAVMYRYHPRWQIVHRLIRSGEIGGLRHLQGSFTFQLGPPPDIRWEKDLGGGALYDVGSYLVNAARWLAGEPTLVLARAQLRHSVDSDGSLLLEFPNSGGPVSAELAYSFESAEHQSLELIGTKGSLQIPKPFTAWRGESLPVYLRRESDGNTEVVACPAADPYQEMVEMFTARIRGGPALITGPEDAELGLRVLDAARRSFGSSTWEAP